MNVSSDSQFDPLADDSVVLPRAPLASLGTAARAGVVNRTHRVIRHRAKVIKARRTHVRGLMAPLILCSVLLLLTVAAVWSGLYQYQAAEAVQADVAALAASDAANHLLVVLLWFVPVSMAVLGTFLFRRSRSGVDRETVR
jgi:hypothetical protein